MKILLVVGLVIAATIWMAQDTPLSSWSCDSLRDEQQQIAATRVALAETMRGVPVVSMQAYEVDGGYTQTRLNVLWSRSVDVADELQHRC